MSPLKFGFDDGTVVIKVGTDKPIMSMDKTGKTIWCVNSDVVTGSVKGIDVADGEVVSLSQKDLGRADMFPTSISHNMNGRFVAMVGDGEYIVSTSMKLRNKCYGQCQELAWSSLKSNDFALRLANSSISIFKNFKEFSTIKTAGHVEHIFGGSLLGVADDSCVKFYDWEKCELVRQIDVAPKASECVRECVSE